jgi:hypothetical protein
MNLSRLTLTKGLIALVVLLFARAAMADVSIDNFSCSDSLTITGEGPFSDGFDSSFISCPGSIGGTREDFILVGSGVSSSAVTTISSNGAGAITGTFGSGISGYEGMNWSGPSHANDLNVDLAGDPSILVQLQSDSGGNLLLFFASTPGNLVEYSAAFAGSPGYQDVFIPLTNPTLTGSGPWPSLTDEPEILLDIGLNTPGGTWSIDGVAAVTTPEPSTLLVTGICLLGVLARPRWLRSPR